LNAVEEIRAAIDKLTALKSVDLMYPDQYDADTDADFKAACNLIGTLHRTIDAQLSILASALEEIARWVDLEGEWGWEESDGPVPTGKSFQGKLDLARAINGVTS
jgi:hypothetical protein